MYHLLLKGIEYEEKKTEQYSLYRCLTPKIIAYRIYPNIYEEIKAGFMPNIDFKLIDIHKAIHYAAWGGHRWLVNNFYYTSKTTDRFVYYMEGAYKGGHMDLFEYFLVRAFQQRENQGFMELYREHDIIKYNNSESKYEEHTHKLDDISCDWYRNIVQNTYLKRPADLSHIIDFLYSILRFMYNSRWNSIFREMIESDMQNYHSDYAIQYFTQLNILKQYELSAINGNIDEIKSISLVDDYRTTKYIMTGAILGAQLEIIQYIQDNTDITIGDMSNIIPLSVDYKKILDYCWRNLTYDNHADLLVGAARISMEIFKDIFHTYSYGKANLDLIIDSLIQDGCIKAVMYLMKLYYSGTDHTYYDRYIKYILSEFNISYELPLDDNKILKRQFKLLKFLIEQGAKDIPIIMIEGVFSQNYLLIQLALSNAINWQTIKGEFMFAIHSDVKDDDVVNFLEYCDKMITRQGSTAISV